MIRILILFFALLLSVSCKIADTKNPNSRRPYSSWEKEIPAKHFSSNQDAALVFQRIYHENVSKADFLPRFLGFLDTSEKCYWYAIYLDEPYYTNINNFELAVQVMKKGIEMEKSEVELVPFHFMLGKKYYHRKMMKEAAEHLVLGYRLSKKYPYSVPAWENEEEYNSVMKFIQSNLKEGEK